MKIDHLGIAVQDLDASVKLYQASLEWKKQTDKIHDPVQKVNIVFMIDDHGNRYELLEPAGVDSPISKLLERKVSLYHFCYEVQNINDKINELSKHGYLLITGPVKAIAFNNRLIAFLINRDNLIIELVEQ